MRPFWYSCCVLVLAALLFRCLVGYHPYSGHSDPPLFGDYEAQRHWMEITTHLPVREWYRDTPDNELKYWGLDYPPLSGYQSWLCGQLLAWLDPDAIALHTSRGYETSFSKMLMRLTVLLSDALTYIPAAVAFTKSAHPTKSPTGRRSALWALFVLLFQPAAVLIDHGHFQYNCISLGLTLGAVAALWRDADLLGSVLFVAALNHKHMAMYYAPAFFAYLLGKSLQKPTWRARIAAISGLGMTVVATFCACWLPFLGTLEDAQTVLTRLVPLRRGLYENYVANFWCSTAPLCRWKHVFAIETLALMCLGATLAAALPSILHQIRRPSKTGFLYCLTNCSLAFFLFAFQVHEKSVLLPLLPITLLSSHHPSAAKWLPLLGCFSMYPMLQRDGLTMAYAASLLLWAAAVWPRPLVTSFWDGRSSSAAPTPREEDHGLESALERRLWPVLAGASLPVMLLLHYTRVVVPPPARLPHLHDGLFVGFAFLHLLSAAIYFNIAQWRHQPPADPLKKCV